MKTFYNKKNARCMWCKRTNNPHLDYRHENIPVKILTSAKGRDVELCLYCYEKDIKKYKNKINLVLDKKIEFLKLFEKITKS